jgi:membrane protease YdiL (CAAX protease family)
MQGPIERRFGLPVAILVSGTLFALVHLDFTPVLWPYYVGVAALYGVVTSLTRSILPAIALHTAGNLYSNFDLWMHGRAEWQTPAQGSRLIWETGADPDFWFNCAALVALTAAACWAFRRLADWSRAT